MAKKEDEKELKDEQEELTEPKEKEQESEETAEEEKAAAEEEKEAAEPENEPEEGSEEEAAGEETPEEEEASEKKKVFRKKEKKDKKDERIEELTDRVARQMAEFENFRKRTEKEKTQMFETGAKSIIEKILPVIDNFERGLAAVPEDEKDSPFVDGMDKVYKQMLTELENAGVSPIEAVGQEFDPELHNAVMQVESEEYDSGIVAQELQKGYKYRDSVVRHSMVAVVQ